jgi:hypothetical protein
VTRQGCQIRVSHELRKILYVVAVDVELFFKLSNIIGCSTESVFGLFSPFYLGHSGYDLSRGWLSGSAADDPLSTIWSLIIGFVAFIEQSCEDTFHLRLDVIKLVFDRLVGLDSSLEKNFFTLFGDHSDKHLLLLIVELKLCQTIENFIEHALNLVHLISTTRGDDVKDLIEREEIESRECYALCFQVILQLRVDFIKNGVLLHKVLEEVFLLITFLGIAFFHKRCDCRSPRYLRHQSFPELVDILELSVLNW